MEKYDVIIIGAGPAGLSASIYTARAGLKTLVVDESSAGGQVKTTHQVANYPGFVEPISGYELSQKMYKQASNFGVHFELISDLETIQLKGDIKTIQLDDGTKHTASFLIIATGRSSRNLNIPGEEENKGKKVSYCATCDGDFYKDKDVFVIGGGNSAMEESLLLLKLVNSITVIHQFDHLQAEDITAKKVKENPKVSFMWSHEPRAFNSVNGKIEVEIEDVKTHQRTKEVRDGVFVFVGMIPNSKFLENTDIDINKHGYISADNKTMETNVKGVFAVGDVRDKNHWQITTAVADGTIAALEVIALS